MIEEFKDFYAPEIKDRGAYCFYHVCHLSFSLKLYPC